VVQVHVALAHACVLSHCGTGRPHRVTPRLREPISAPAICTLFRHNPREDILKLPVEKGGKFQSGLNLLNIWRDASQ
jgi:hypothetical protein